MGFNIPNKYDNYLDLDYSKDENSDPIYGKSKSSVKDFSDSCYLDDKHTTKSRHKELNQLFNLNFYSINENLNLEKTVKFSQSEMIFDQKIPKELNKIDLKFNGLCELVCNKILIDDLLNKGNGDFLKEKITITELNKDEILKSHILNVYSVSQRISAFMFSIYPDNIFSKRKQWKLVKKNRVNQNILFSGLEKIESGTTLKLEIFKKTSTSFSGHSSLIKKNDENEFTFFDPDTGEHRRLSQYGVMQKINEQLSRWSGTDIFISKGDSYIKKLKDKNIIEK